MDIIEKIDLFLGEAGVAAGAEPSPGTSTGDIAKHVTGKDIITRRKKKKKKTTTQPSAKRGSTLQSAEMPDASGAKQFGS